MSFMYRMLEKKYFSAVLTLSSAFSEAMGLTVSSQCCRLPFTINTSQASAEKSPLHSQQAQF